MKFPFPSQFLFSHILQLKGSPESYKYDLSKDSPFCYNVIIVIAARRKFGEMDKEIKQLKTENTQLEEQLGKKKCIIL